MSKERARNPESYAKEELLLAIVPALLEAKGFVHVEVKRKGQMKFVVAAGIDGGKVTFWLKQGWSDTKDYSAIQFGMLEGSDPAGAPDAAFIDFVLARTLSAKQSGASHALLVHMFEGKIQDYVVLAIDDVVVAYTAQIAGWPNLARATKMPTLFFEDRRNLRDAGYVDVVTNLEVSLENLSNRMPAAEGPGPIPASKKITAEVEFRMQQRLFRLLVGKRYGWRCPVSGSTVREVLDAAHLPGRDWRFHNQATDGVLLRADLHRLLDRGLATIDDERFLVRKDLRLGEYAQFHSRPTMPNEGENS
jgi:hypothetical protein